MNLKLDENLPSQAVSLLRSAGHDVSTVLAQGMGGASDEELVRTVVEEGRILLTLDLDFADIRTYPPQALPGIIVLRLKALDRDSVLSALGNLVTFLQHENPQGKLWIVDGSRLRVRE